MSLKTDDLPTIADLLSLTGKTAVVTGGARGIGAAICYRLAEAGATIVIGDLDEKAAHETADRLRAVFGLPVHVRPLDVTKSVSVADLAQWTVENCGGCDIWVNNAGIYPFGNLLDIDDEAWERVSAINERGTFFGCREAARQMTALGRNGVILNLSSVAGLRGRPSLAHYAASKHAVVGLTRSLAIELGPRGIRVLALAPTLVQTPGIAARDEGNDGTSTFKRTVTQRLPLQRIAMPDDVARAALFCVSELSALITGAVIPVDAGALA